MGSQAPKPVWAGCRLPSCHLILASQLAGLRACCPLPSLPVLPCIAPSHLCLPFLPAPQVEDFTEAVRRHYWYEFFADELPIWGFVGPPPEQTKGDTNVYIYTHKTLDIAYNGDRVGVLGAGSVCWVLQPAGAH